MLSSAIISAESIALLQHILIKSRVKIRRSSAHKTYVTFNRQRCTWRGSQHGKKRSTAQWTVPWSDYEKHLGLLSLNRHDSISDEIVGSEV
jgi:hypothetical protein